MQDFAGRGGTSGGNKFLVISMVKKVNGKKVMDINFLKYKAYKLRELSIKATTQAGSGHPTSCLSAADIVAVLFFDVMKYDPQNPKNINNDRFILSKGHAAPLLYAAWEQVGVITEKDLLTLRQFDSNLEGHPTPRFKYNEAATGSLGMGLSIGAGFALSAKLNGLDFKTYVLMGDAEIAEGQIWEAAEISTHYKLDNLIGIVDVNRLGQSTENLDDHNLNKIKNKFDAFGWQTFEVNGHEVKELVEVFAAAQKIKNKPVMILAKTFKGHGISDVENKLGFHGKVFPQKDLAKILDELKNRFKKDSEYQENSNWEPEKPDRSTGQLTARPECFQSASEENVSRDGGKNHGESAIKLPSPEYKVGEQIPTRKAYGQALAQLGKVCEQVVSLDGDVKNSTFAEIFEAAFPKRFFQCFVAEQNMVSMAVGLASRGKLPFVSTFASFITRAHDQIRMAAIGRSNIKIVGSHAGVSIGEDGPSQMGLEDIALMRTVPESVILYPCDAVSTQNCVELMANYNSGISYLRTTRGATACIYDPSEKFELGGFKVLKKSSQDLVCIIAAGITVFEALRAHELLDKKGIKARIIDLYCVKPINAQTLAKEISESSGRLITVEDSYIEGGIGEAICTALKNRSFYIEHMAVTKLPRSGSPEELLAFEEIDHQSIINMTERMVKQ